MTHCNSSPCRRSNRYHKTNNGNLSASFNELTHLSQASTTKQQSPHCSDSVHHYSRENKTSALPRVPASDSLGPTVIADTSPERDAVTDMCCWCDALPPPARRTEIARGIAASRHLPERATNIWSGSRRRDT